MFISSLLLVLVSTSAQAASTSPAVCQTIQKIATCAMKDGSDTNCDSGGTADYSGIAASAKATFEQMQAQCPGGGHMLVGGSSDVTPYDSLDDTHNGGLAASRAGKTFNAIVGGGVYGSEALMLRTEVRWIQRLADDGAKYGFIWVVSDEMLRQVPGQDLIAKQLEDSLKLDLYRARNLPDASHAWGGYMLAGMDSMCPATLILHQDGMPEYIQGPCECPDTPMSSADGYVTVSTWGSGVRSEGMYSEDKGPRAYDFYYQRQKWGGIKTCPDAGKEDYVWDPMKNECRKPKNSAEALAALIGEKEPDYSSEVFGYSLVYVARHGAHVTGDIFREGKLVIEFPGKCEQILAENERIAEADRLAQYRGVSGTFAIVGVPGYAYPPEPNPYRLEQSPVGEVEAHVGLRFGWLKYRTAKKGPIKGATVPEVKSVNANAMSAGIDVFGGAGYYGRSCTMPGSYGTGAEFIVSGGRANDLGWSGGLGAMIAWGQYGGEFVLNHEDAFVDFTLDVHPGGSVGNTTFMVGLRQSFMLVSGDPEGSSLQLASDPTVYTAGVPWTGAVLGLRW